MVELKADTRVDVYEDAKDHSDVGGTVLVHFTECLPSRQIVQHRLLPLLLRQIRDRTGVNDGVLKLRVGSHRRARLHGIDAMFDQSDLGRIRKGLLCRDHWSWMK